MNEVSLQSSFDAGASFGPSLRLSRRAFDSRIGFGAKEGLGLGLAGLALLGLWVRGRGTTKRPVHRPPAAKQTQHSA